MNHLVLVGERVIVDASDEALNGEEPCKHAELSFMSRTGEWRLEPPVGDLSHERRG